MSHVDCTVFDMSSWYEKFYVEKNISIKCIFYDSPNLCPSYGHLELQFIQGWLLESRQQALLWHLYCRAHIYAHLK